jgi:hypothetical protein
MARIPVVAFIPIVKIAMVMTVAMGMVMAVKRWTIIARAMRLVVTIYTQIGTLIITMILSIIARVTRYGSTGSSIISIVKVGHA